jgi:hypothetical protein
MKYILLTVLFALSSCATSDTVARKGCKTDKAEGCKTKKEKVVKKKCKSGGCKTKKATT